MATPQQRQAYSVAEAAAALGVSAWLVRELCRTGELRYVRLRNRIIITAAALDELLTTAPESEANAAT